MDNSMDRSAAASSLDCKAQEFLNFQLDQQKIVLQKPTEI